MKQKCNSKEKLHYEFGSGKQSIRTKVSAMILYIADTSLRYFVHICDANSPDGIDNGRVLKLFLYAEDGEQEIAAYERGWLVYPSGKDEAIMDALLAYCARLPNAEDWQAETNQTCVR